jgi:hypothetical protein
LFSYIRVIFSKHFFSNFKSPLAERLCLLVLPSFAIKNSEIVQGSSNLKGKES